jgi:replication factor A1
MSNLTETKNQSGMSISDLKPGMRRIDVTGQITDIETPRDVQTKFGPGQVASATFKDSTGIVKLTLWNENIEKVSVGDTVHIENAYVDSFRGELQVQVGRYGKITIQ